MSNVIHFLESMGGNAVMARMNIADYKAAIEMLDTDNESREALRGRDEVMLLDSLKGRPQMLCAVFAPDEKEQEKVPSEGGDDERSPDQKNPDQ